MSGQPTHALFVIDNWDGEANRYWTFAYEKDGVFYSSDNKPILEHNGDEILKMISLTLADESKPQAYIVNSFVDACLDAEGDIEDSCYMWDLSDVKNFADKYNKK